MVIIIKIGVLITLILMAAALSLSTCIGENPRISVLIMIHIGIGGTMCAAVVQFLINNL